MNQLPEMKSVSSTSVSEAGYDPATEKMYLRFSGGQLYEYDDVKQHDFDGLISAPSIGKLIRGLPYSYRKVSG